MGSKGCYFRCHSQLKQDLWYEIATVTDGFLDAWVAAAYPFCYLDLLLSLENMKNQITTCYFSLIPGERWLLCDHQYLPRKGWATRTKDCLTWTEGLLKRVSIPSQGRDKAVYTPPSPDPTSGITLDMLLSGTQLLTNLIQTKQDFMKKRCLCSLHLGGFSCCFKDLTLHLS